MAGGRRSLRAVRRRVLEAALALGVLGLSVGCDAVLDRPVASDSRAPVDDGRDRGSDGAGDDRCRDAAFDPGPTLVRRLSPWEVAGIVQTAFDVDVADAIREAWPPRARVGGLSNAAQTQVATLAHIEAFEQVAALVAEAVDIDRELEVCGDLEGPECALTFSRTIGEELFRRSVPAAGAARWARLFLEAPTRGEGARWVLRGMLQSGSFLYRVETEPDGSDIAPVAADELATRLAFLVWGEGPDDELREAAERGDLDDEASIRRQVARLLADPRAERHALDFVTDWLGIASVEESNVAGAYEGADRDLLADMKAETLATSRKLLFEDEAPLERLLTSKRAVLSPRLARWYGLDPVGEEPVEIALPGPRSGLLTQGAVLAQAAGAEESMIARGLYILRNITCRDLPPPPPDLDTSDDGSADAATEREASDHRLGRPQCATCHSSMEPLAHAFEPFDGAGRYRTLDEEGNALRSDGSVTLPTGEALEWSSPDEFVRKLARTGAVQRCLVEKPLAFALGRPISDRGSDACVVEQIRAEYTSAGGTYADLVRAIATHPIFRMMRPKEVED